jgi:hypothetical protein
MTGISQQGKKHASLDMDDLSPMSKTIETLNAGVTGWAQITPEDGRFTVMMPGAVTAESATLSLRLGQAFVHRFDSDLSGRKFMAIYVDYTYSFDSSDIELFFNELPGLLVDDGYDVLTQNSIKYGNNPGRELIVLSGNERIYVKMYFVGTREYAVSVRDGNDKKQSEDCKKFLNSFTLLGH